MRFAQHVIGARDAQNPSKSFAVTCFSEPGVPDNRGLMISRPCRYSRRSDISRSESSQGDTLHPRILTYANTEGLHVKTAGQTATVSLLVIPQYDIYRCIEQN